MKKAIMYEQIYRDIAEGIQNGEYGTMDLLPSEKEIAEKYGVSRITAARAMKMLAEQGLIERTQGKGSFVSPDARTRLQEGAANGSESVAPGKCIGVIIDSFGPDFGDRLLKGIERECHRSDVDILFRCTYGSIDEENEAIERSLRRGCEGLILMPVQGERYNDTVLRLALNRYPVVLVDREMKGVGIPCVKTDNTLATRELVEAMILKGHKKLCLVTHPSESTPTIEARSSAFRDGILAHKDCQGVIEKLEGYQTTPEVYEKDYVEANIERAKEIIQRQRECTAFFAVEYKIGVLLAKACRELELERAIFAFDYLNGIFDDQLHLPHVQQNEYGIGRAAVRTLLRMLSGEAVEPVINVPHTLVQ